MDLIMRKAGAVVALFALLVTSLSVNSPCMLIAHQPEIPESAKKLRKF